MNELCERWLTFARQDLKVAEIILNEEIYNQVCFHAQQCIEKSLKAVLANQGNATPRTHSIADLLRLVSQEHFSSLKDTLLKMDNFYIPTRYPDALPGSLPEGLPDRKEAEEALASARSVLQKTEELCRESYLICIP